MKFIPQTENLDKTLGFLLLRLWLGVRALITGVEKYTAKISHEIPEVDADGMETGLTKVVKVKEYALSHYHALPQTFADMFKDEPLMNIWPWVYDTFCSVLGVVLIVLGLTTLLGLFTRVSIFLQGVLYVGLTFGFIILAVDAGIAQLGLHVLLCALALSWAKYNVFAITKKW